MVSTLLWERIHVLFRHLYQSINTFTSIPRSQVKVMKHGDEVNPKGCVQEQTAIRIQDEKYVAESVVFHIIDTLPIE